MDSSEEGKSNRSAEVLGTNLTELKEALLSSIERIEGILSEAESTASHEAQQYEELRQMSEAKLGMLEAKLQEEEESLRSKESAIKQLEENLNSKIQELEHQLTEKEDFSRLLEEHNSEITILKSEAEEKLGVLEAKLQEEEESLRSKESAIKQLEENLNSKIEELEHQLTEKEDFSRLLEEHNSEIKILKSEAEAKLGMLETKLQEREESLRKKESSSLQMEERLTAEIQYLEGQLGEIASLLDIGQAELNEVSSKLNDLGDSSEGIVTLREEDVVTRSLPNHEGEKGIYRSKVQEKMTEDLKDMVVEAERLRAQIQERDAMLAAKETEVKMITRAMEEEVSRQRLEKEESLQARDAAAKQQEDILTATIHDLEGQLREKEALLSKGDQKKGLQDSMSAELERLKADMRDRNLLLEARETELKMIKQSVQEKFRGLERIVHRPEEGEARKSRLISLLATIEKKH